MDFALEQDVKEIFALAAEARAEKRREKEIALLFERLDREKRDKLKSKEKEEKEIKELEDVLATTEQIAAFNSRLDDLDAKTVHCLMENGEALDKVREQLRNMMEDAYVLPDGRRVFKTEDGQRVLDEHGAEVAHETIDPQMIDGTSTTWEAFKATKNAEDKLEIERHDLLKFQEKIDEARARVGKGDLTKKDIDTLDADLDANVPPSVRQKLGLPTSSPDDAAKAQPDTPLRATQATLADDAVRRAQTKPAPM